MSRLPKPLTILAIVAVFALAVPAQGAAATPIQRQIAQLQKQVKTLQRQVKTLQTQVRQTQGGLVGTWAAVTCQTAITADLFQGTWVAIDAREEPDLFGPQQPVNDYANCGLFQNPAVPRPGIQNPPSVAAFSPLLALLHIEP